MATGDHIYYPMSSYMGMAYHHGIDCGDGTVIHYDGQKKGSKGIICRISKYQFVQGAKGEEIRIQEYGKCDSPEVVVARAISKLDEQKYGLVTNNCEHFAYYCKTGEYKSEQVNQAEARTVGIVGGIAGTVAAATIGGSAAIAAAVAAPAVLGIAAAIGVYHLSKGEQE